MYGRLATRCVCRVLAAAALLTATACTDRASIELADWTLVDAAGSHEIRIPAEVDDLLETRGDGYRLTASVQLPPSLRGQPLTLAIPRLPALVDLRANGVLIEPAESTFLVGYRSPGAHRWRLRGDLTSGDRLELELSAVDTWYQSSWIASTARLSTHPEGHGWYRFATRFNHATNTAALALMLMLGLSYLVVFLRDRRRAAFGWYAAQVLCAGAYPLFTIGASQLAFGTFDVYTVPLVSIAALASIYSTHTHFDLPTPRRFWTWLAMANVFVTIAFGDRFSCQWSSVPLTVATVSVAAVYQLQLGMRLLVSKARRRAGAFTFFMSWVLLSIFVAPDLVYWVGFGSWLEGVSGAGLGISLFTVLQASALSRQFEQSMERTDALNAELAERVTLLEARDRENRALNEELRRQVSARSRQLSHALARLGRSIAKPVTPTDGMVIDDRYRIVRKLGEGAMATVYQVVRLEDGRELALKQLKSSSDARILARFAREAHIASEVSHPNLVSIHDIDFASDGFMYIVMDLVSGGAVSDHRERFGDVPWALQVLSQTARGLAALHDSGVVHRDLKPANILLQEGDSVVAKISDFGVSGMLDDTGSDLRRLAHAQSDGPTPTAVTRADVGSSNETLDTESIDVSALERRAALDSPLLTQAGHLLGTPAYMAPELHEGVDSAPVRDVFSFGVLAFELLTGERPYSTPPLLCRLRRQTTDEARQLADACPALNPELARHLQAAVSLVPDERPTLEILVAAFDNA